MRDAKINDNTKILLFLVSILTFLMLSLTNIKNITSKKEVLGIDTKIYSSEEFWNDFLTKNPDYIPGWVEIGRIDKVSSINPNYLQITDK